MRLTFLLSALALTASLAEPEVARGEQAVPNRPNIVIILADDMGFGEVEALNPERCKVPTPNLDRFASEGMTFTDAHSPSAVCSPTRYALLTGRYAWRTKMQSSALLPYEEPLIAADRLTLAAMLKPLGYRTACIGKWHLGWNWPPGPEAQKDFTRPLTNGPTTRGFDSYFGTDVPNYPPYCFIENDRTVGLPSVPKPEEIYGNPGIMLPGWRLEPILPALGEKACEFIAACAAAKAPFFLYLPLTSPHTPIAPTEEFRGKSLIGPYGDWVIETDAVVGRVLDAIDKSGVRDNTLVVFTSDNGHAPYVGTADFEAKGHYPSGPWRGYKADLWEGGHRVAFFVRWPGRVAPRSRCTQTICHVDLLATCAEILGVKVPASAGEDSVSLLSLFQGKDVPVHEAVIHHSVVGRFAIRQGRWKLLLAPDSGGYRSRPTTDPKAVRQGLPPIQLYDLQSDPGETTNLYKQHPEVVARLREILQRYVANGRSTPGAPQENDVAIDIEKAPQTK
jgi:arylsulfatase A-like enzyme